MKIALNVKETKIASILAHKYKVLIYEEMVIRAIKTDQFEFLFQVYQMNKNYEFIIESDSDDDSDVTSQTSSVYSNSNKSIKEK